MEIKPLTDKSSTLVLAQSASDYFRLLNGTNPEMADIEAIFTAVPPGKTLADKQLLGIYKQGELLGMVDFYRDYPKRGTWWIGLLLLSQRSRGRGIGKWVHEELWKLAHVEGVSKFQLGVVDKNEKALAFWQGLGYEKVRKKDDILVMELMRMEFKDTKWIADKDLRALYTAVGWTSYTEKFSDLSVLLRNCQLVYSAWDGDKLVGFVRAVGDGYSIQYVQDLMVAPDYQRLGIGKQLLGYVLEQSAHIRTLVLMTDDSEENRGVLEFYRKMGLSDFETSGVCGFVRWIK